jgi:hypothetical protein
MCAKFSLLVTAVVTALMAGIVFSSYSIISVYAVHVNPDRFCFTTTNTVGVTGACAQSMGLCKQTEDLYASQGYTIAQHCAKTGGFPI